MTTREQLEKEIDTVYKNYKYTNKTIVEIFLFDRLVSAREEIERLKLQHDKDIEKVDDALSRLSEVLKKRNEL